MTRKSTLKYVTLFPVLSFFCLFLLFLIVEKLVASRVLDLGNNPYFGLVEAFQADDQLVYLPRIPVPDIEVNYYPGDLYFQAYGSDFKKIRMHAHHDEHGFRKSLGPRPHEIIVLGDSFVYTGETDDRTFPEYLRFFSNRSVHNFGLPGQGPAVHLELMKRFGLAEQPRLAILAFTGMNDFEDTQEYLQWQKGNGYGSFGATFKNPFRRFFKAAIIISSHAYRKARASIVSPASESPHDQATAANNAIHPDLAYVGDVSRGFALRVYIPNIRPSKQELMESPAGKRIAQAFSEFANLCHEQETFHSLSISLQHLKCTQTFFQKKVGRLFKNSFLNSSHFSIPDVKHFENW